jgi:hypothetical protein
MSKKMFISNKTLPIEYPLNIRSANEEIPFNMLLSKLNYTKNIINVNSTDENNKQINEEITLRNVNIKKEKNLSSYDLIFNDCKNFDINYDESLEEKYNRIIYKKIEPSEAEDEDVDSLTKNIILEIKKINNNIKMKHVKTLCIESFLNEKTTFVGDDADILNKCDEIFKKFLDNSVTKDL